MYLIIKDILYFALSSSFSLHLFVKNIVFMSSSRENQNTKIKHIYKIWEFVTAAIWKFNVI